MSLSVYECVVLMGLKRAVVLVKVTHLQTLRVSDSDRMMGLRSLLLLFSTTLLMSISSSHASGAVTPCCIEMKGTMVRRDLIKRYYIQDTAMCNIKAVTFVTVKGIRICSDPSNPWAKKTMQYLDNKNKPHTLRKHHITSTTTTTTTGAQPAKYNPHKTTFSAHNPKIASQWPTTLTTRQ
ncbi:C-C motif chemokine 2-like [Oncorhynchus keta]|uniref:C-C motif chemokine 2-like n=1 Tax=Oncorhynchus keta TaxID=8018 RepID=UPI0015FE1A0E|nr:C-C motif chemokine 2-like [Oncorhynchus keta]